jgi:glyoxylase-like metal-dependent hydrolase (beta-lactamase superfamily II)
MVTIRLSKTNCYILKTKTGLLLVDTGYEADQSLFYKKLKQNNIHVNDIKYLFLTHHHDDHSGLLNELTSRNPELQVIMSKECLQLLKDGENSRKYGGAWCCRNMKRMAELYSKVNKKWTLKFPPYFGRDNDIILENQDVDLEPKIGANFKSIYSPGHSPDRISLLDEDMNLFCGDAASDYLRILGTKYAPPFVTDLNRMYETWQKFIDSGVKVLYPSHGKPIKIDKLKKNIHKLRIEKMGEFVWS